jgi:hypothetical protein
MRLKTEVEELKREQKKKQQIGESLFPVSFTSKILYLCTTSLVTSKRKSVFVSLFSICTRSHSTDAYLRENTLIGGGVPIYICTRSLSTDAYLRALWLSFTSALGLFYLGMRSLLTLMRKSVCVVLFNIYSA